MKPDLAQKLLSDESLMKGVLAAILSIAKSVVENNQELSEALSKITVEETLLRFKLYLQNIVILHTVSGMVIGKNTDTAVDFTKGGIVPAPIGLGNPFTAQGETIISKSQQRELLDVITKKS